MNEQARYRVTGSLFLLAVAVITLPMLFDGDGVPGVALEPVATDFTPPKVRRLSEVAPASDFKERVAELREQVDDEGFHRDTQTRIGEPVLSAPDESTEVWAIQLASFAEQSNARAFRDRLRQDGYEAFFTSYKPRGSEILSRVAVGPVLNPTRALRLQDELSNRYEVQARVMAFGN